MLELLQKSCRDIRCQLERLEKAVAEGCYEEVHCLAKGIGASAFDACHAACCCCDEPEAARKPK